ncbi:hypothetical protein Misp01_48350 [Microtetraspora sp. NBRC 13810]|uniref:DUF6493 family protein n=1 Tax=Microtetraspora sp. NBRC 13810 TaxID=3030990 RepID=UPI0024A53136|nr:DUF6493 family protein [Microtetraspora sp. NBRC 13810]GLW09706.1 hypothetical protein Misp01_48350 [Microtetraspora sp. NBRC 13810]
MNPWQHVRDWIETGENNAGLPAFLAGLSDLGRKAIAVQLPGYLAERLRGEGASRWEVVEQAPAFRIVGAACLSGAAQVAAWLNRREFRDPRAPKVDAERILRVVRDRQEEWRRDLAHRLVAGLRPSTRGGWSNAEGEPGWELAASLVIETGIAPPENDAFVVGWVWDLHRKLRVGAKIDVVREHPLLDAMVPRLFHAEGVAVALTQDWRWNNGDGSLSVIGALADLAAEGRVDRRSLLNGCAARFLTAGQARDIEPFVILWNELRPALTEVPVVDLVRVLPVAASPLARLAADELRRVDDAAGLDQDLFAEAVGALAFRPEKKLVTTALQWIAGAAPERADGSLAALALIFGQETPALRDRAVRLALKLAPHASPATADVIREAAAALPAELLGQIAGAFGEVVPALPESPVAGTLPATVSLPDLPPEIVSVAELAGKISPGRLSYGPMEIERILAAMVEWTHRDRAATAEALRPWWEESWARWGRTAYPYVDSHVAYSPYSLLRHCALAIVSPADSVRCSGQITEYLDKNPPYRTVLDWLVRDRLREVIALLESGRTIPVLLATPTAPTGHLDPGTLVSRLELLGDSEPLPLDFCQALLRLPRSVAPEVVARAENLTSPAGRRLAAWLRDGGLADPVMEYGIEATSRSVSYQTYARIPAMHVRMNPPAQDLPEAIGDLCVLEPKEWWAGHSDETEWWPVTMPSHREVIAAHVLECFAVGLQVNRAQPEVLIPLVQGEGPVGRATASAIVTVLGHRQPAQRALAVDAAKILAVRGELVGGDFGWALGRLVRADVVKLNRVAPALEDLALSGAHHETWAVLADALPALLPAAGERPLTGLAALLAVAVKAAALAGAQADVPGLAETAARKGGSRVVEEARRLLRTINTR